MNLSPAVTLTNTSWLLSFKTYVIKRWSEMTRNRLDLIGKEPVLKFSIPFFLFIVILSMTFSLASCKKEEPGNDDNKKSSMTEEDAEEEVKY
jgi:hypothetical protein